LILPAIVTMDGQFGFNGDQFGFDVSGVSNQTVVVQGSTNLFNWIPLQTNTLTAPTWFFSDPASGGLGLRFYRLQLIP
jgi:hypothetical protein